VRAARPSPVSLRSPTSPAKSGRGVRNPSQAENALVLLLPLSFLLSLGACSPDYPFDKPGTWNIPPGQLGSNDANLRAMIVDPNDLVTGAAESGSTGTAAAHPVSNLNAGRRPRLPDINGIPLGSSGGQTSGTPGQAGSNGSIQQ
jgi:hypothetical protein